MSAKRVILYVNAPFCLTILRLFVFWCCFMLLLLVLLLAKFLPRPKMLWLKVLLAKIFIRYQREKKALSWQVPLVWNLLKNNQKFHFLVGLFILSKILKRVLPCSFKMVKNAIQLRKSRQQAAIAQERKTRQMAKQYEFDPKIVEMMKEMTAGKLLPLLKSGDITSEAVVRAYIHIAREQDKKYNFIVDCLFDEAIERAKFLDKYREEKGKPYGLLHGLPVSFKETFQMKNRVTFLGSQKMANFRADEDAVLVQRIFSEGGIIIFRTNVPQSMLVPETSNAVHGLTKNPHNVERAPGGSSGGESVAVASGASVCGFGTDIGGSCRIPAAWSGCVGFKPTYARLSKKGSKTLNPAFTILSCAGTLSPDVESTIVLLEGATAEESDGANPPFVSTLDPLIPPPTSWRVRNTQRKRVGICTYDGFFTPSVSCVRAVNIAARSLEKQGWEIVELPGERFQPLFVRCCYLFLALIGWDGGHATNSKLFGEDIEQNLQIVRKSIGMPLWLRGIMVNIMNIMGEKRASDVLRAGYPCDAKEIRDMFTERDGLKAEILKEWEKLQIDCVLYPSMGFPPVRNGESGSILPALSYTYLWNVLDFPAGVVPVGKVSAHDVTNRVVRGGISPFNKTANLTDIGSEGLPIAVQVIGKPYHDEQCLYVMQEVEKSLQKE